MLKGWEDLKLLDNFIDDNFIGVYALSHNGRNVHYVGRSLGELKSRIKSSHERGEDYMFFAYEYVSSNREAFLLECKYYHECTPADNLMHPVAPKGVDSRCPVPDCSSA
jgi:hypothetical protein